MWNWLKRKKSPESLVQQTTEDKFSRTEIVANAMKNLQDARHKIGEERLQQLASLILQKKTEKDDTSPAEQAKKIIAQMDKAKLGQLMQLMVQDNQTKH